MKARDVAENVWVLLTARGAMIATPFVLYALSVMAVDYLDNRFAAQTTATAVVAGRVDKLEAAATEAAETVDGIEKRLIILETNNARGRAERELFQQQTFARLDKLNDSLISLSNTVAALTATVQTMRDRADAGRPRTTVTR